jgi:hypothetical protein
MAQDEGSMLFDRLRRPNLRRGCRVEMAIVRDLFEVDVGMEEERFAHVA